MKILILSAYEILTVLLPVTFLFFCFRRLYTGRGMGQVNVHFAWLLIFAVYIFAVFHVTGTGTLYDLLRYGVGARPEQINLIPFSREIAVAPYILNIILFLPFGFLLPVIWKRTNNILLSAGAGFAFSMLIEISQLFNNRSTDVDDLIMNTTGALMGFAAYRLFIYRGQRKKKIAGKHVKSIYSRCEPVLYVGAMFLGHFLLFNEFGLAKILYGF